MDAFEKAISIIGSQDKLAELCGLTPMAVSQWKKRGVPANRCRVIQDATSGEVTVHDLRPDIFGPAPGEGAAA